MNRRSILQAMAGLGLGAIACRAVAQPGKPGVTVKDVQDNWKSLLAPGADVAKDAAPLSLTRDEWKKRLSPPQFQVLREEGTERAGTSPLNDEKRPGVFACAGCGLPLFTSAMKFDSGTGWPSFFTTIPGAFGKSTDYKLILPRTEYHCAKCGGHHGHVFDDGPQPTGQRWCNNGIVLRFIPKSA